MCVKVLYIAGCTHSGSTLLNRVLGAHSQAVTLGSVKKLPVLLRKGSQCNCGSAVVECPFWRAVNEELVRRGKSLESLDVVVRNPQRFAEDNRDLYESAIAVSNAKVIVESSRRSSRLRRLRAIPGFELVPVHLYKSPQTQAGSWKRKGKWFFQFPTGYLSRNMRIRAACRNDPATQMLSYELFCKQPETELRRIFAAAQLEYEPAILTGWGEATIHTLGGNRMKKLTSSKIVLDEGWRKRLSKWEIKLMQWTCGPLWQRMEAQRQAAKINPA